MRLNPPDSNIKGYGKLCCRPEKLFLEAVGKRLGGDGPKLHSTRERREGLRGEAGPRRRIIRTPVEGSLREGETRVVFFVKLFLRFTVYFFGARLHKAFSL